MVDDRWEDEENDGEESFADLLEKSFVGGMDLKPGQKVEAEILKITADWIFLDVGQKGEGVLDRKELLDAEGTLTVAEGDVVAAHFVSRSGGELRFTTRMGGAGTGSAQLEEAWRSGIPVDGLVEKENKGGYEIKLAGQVRAFCPHSQMALRRTEDPSQFVGRHLPFKISRYEEQGRNIVVSHRARLEEEQQRQREELRQSLQEGMTVAGTVTSLRDFGAFVDIGGLEGLLPISEVGWGRVEDISETLAVGQQVQVVIKKLDWDNQRFSFSLKETLADPWERAPLHFPEGSVHQGKVARLTPFGAFVTLADGIDGLIHISKLGGGKRINHPREVVQEGQQLEVRVESVDSQSRRISLALVGSESESKVVEAKEDFGAYLQEQPGSSMGTLGDLLRQAGGKKKK